MHWIDGSDREEVSTVRYPVTMARKHFGASPRDDHNTLTHYYFHDLSYPLLCAKEFFERRRTVAFTLICLSHPLPILMLDIDISFTPQLTDGSPLVDGIPPFLMIRNFPQEAATYPVSPDASDLIDFLSRWWKYLLSILAIRLERRPTLLFLSRPHL